MIDQLMVGRCDRCDTRYDIRINHECDPKSPLTVNEFEEVKPDGTKVFHEDVKVQFNSEV